MATISMARKHDLPHKKAKDVAEKEELYEECSDKAAMFYISSPESTSPENLQSPKH